MVISWLLKRCTTQRQTPRCGSARHPSEGLRSHNGGRFSARRPASPKGSFFYHFKSKDALALAAVEHFSTMATGLFSSAPYHKATDPLDRLLGYVDFRASILSGELPEYTCLLGTLVQETYDTHPDIRDACDRGMSAHIAELTRDVALAKERHCPTATWSVASS
jgi:TetR/AcrR family transcriptional repressor of nem operon